jgi:hypothetical protein
MRVLTCLELAIPSRRNFNAEDIPYRRVWSASAGERASARIRRQGGGEGARVGRASSSSSASAARTLAASFWLVSLIAINACGLASTTTKGGGPPRSGATGHVLLLFSQLQQEIAALGCRGHRQRISFVAASARAVLSCGAS